MTVDRSVLPRRNDKPAWRRRRRRVLVLMAVLVLTWWFGGLAGAWVATKPRTVDLPPCDQLDGHAVETVSVVASDGVVLGGWLVAASETPRRAVVLAAGIGGNRLALVERARFYVRHGWSALLVDLRGTGESEAVRISLGWHEALDLLACRDLLLQRGYGEVGVHGISLGAAAAAYTAVRDDRPVAWRFTVLESCYTTLTEAVDARTFAPTLATWPMMWWGGWLLGFDPHRLDALAAVTHIEHPLMFVFGGEDRLVGPRAPQRFMAAASRARVCELHVVAGIGHRNLWPTGGRRLRERLLAFLAR